MGDGFQTFMAFYRWRMEGGSRIAAGLGAGRFTQFETDLQIFGRRFVLLFGLALATYEVSLVSTQILFCFADFGTQSRD
ncbi:MAG: hypothetical protein QME81_12275 [bacterium]|nr:hypothetical protein [bacterium]